MDRRFFLELIPALAGLPFMRWGEPEIGLLPWQEKILFDYDNTYAAEKAALGNRIGYYTWTNDPDTHALAERIMDEEIHDMLVYGKGVKTVPW